MKFDKILLAAGLLLLAATSASAAEFTIKFSTIGSQNSAYPRCSALDLLDQIQKESGGRIGHEIYMGGTAFANPVKQYEQAARGVMDITSGPLTYTPGRFALSEIATIPLLVTDNVAGSIAMTRLAKTWLKDEFADIHLMGIILTTPYQFHLKQPIKSVLNLEGLRIRVSGTGLTEMVKAFKGLPASLPLPATYENLQRGVIQGAIAPWTAIPVFKLDEVTSYHVEADLSVGLTFIGMSKKFYNGLPADLRKLIDERFTGDRVAAHGAKCFQKVDELAIARVRKRGNTIVKLSPQERQAAQAILKPVIEKIIVDTEAKGKPARKFYEALRAEIAKVESEHPRQ